MLEKEFGLMLLYDLVFERVSARELMSWKLFELLFGSVFVTAY